jgi:hypothetical protein
MLIASRHGKTRKRTPYTYPDGAEPSLLLLLETRVGAILRFFGAEEPSSFSDSDSPTRFPSTEEGVSGGVVRGRAAGAAELTAVTRGTAPKMGVGLLFTVEAIVAIEDVLFDLVGLPARPEGTPVLDEIGKTLLKDGEVAIVGVGNGVELAEETAVDNEG